VKEFPKVFKDKERRAYNLKTKVPAEKLISQRVKLRLELRYPKIIFVDNVKHGFINEISNVYNMLTSKKCVL
jgi:hypothetical protein